MARPILGGTGKIQTILKTVAVNSLRIVIYDAGNGDGDQIVACTGGVASGGGGRHIGARDVGGRRSAAFTPRDHEHGANRAIWRYAPQSWHHG